MIVVATLFVLRKPSSANESVQPDRTATVERGTLEVWVAGTGEIEPVAQAALSFQVSGNMGVLRVRVGESVQKGEVLVELDPASLDPGLLAAPSELVAARQQLEELLDTPTGTQLAQAQLAVAVALDSLDDAEYSWRVQQEGFRADGETVAAARANLVLAEEEVDQAEAAFNRVSGRRDDDPVKALARSNLAAARQNRDSVLRRLNWYTGRPNEIDQALLDGKVAVAEADLADARETLTELKEGPDPDDVIAAEARLASAQARVDQSRLVAPFDGTVVAVMVSPGDSVSPGTLGVVIADLRQLHIDTLIDELDIASVAIGQTVEITLDALPGVTLSGEVSEIDLVPWAGSATTEYPVVVDLTAVDGSARVGMTAALEILTARLDDVLLAPNWALRFSPQTGEVFVSVQRGGQFEQTTVTLGLRNDIYSQVLSGLSPGDVIGVVVTPEPPAFSGPFGGGD